MASFNAHCAVDGWGRPFDAESVLASIDADVVVLQEAWWPAPAHGAEPTAVMAERALRGTSVRVGLARGRLLGPHPSPGRGWGPLQWIGRHKRALRLDPPERGMPISRPFSHPRPFEGAVPEFPGSACPPLSDSAFIASNGSAAHRGWSEGEWQLAVVARPAIQTRQLIDLGQLRRDVARRAALVVRVEIGGGWLNVVGTHISHLTHGSPRQLRRLRKALSLLGGPSVVLGDMNLWGVAVDRLLPEYRRAVTGSTWPAGRPVAQLDHILVSPGIEVIDGGVVGPSGSDHRPVWARLRLQQSGEGLR